MTIKYRVIFTAHGHSYVSKPFATPEQAESVRVKVYSRAGARVEPVTVYDYPSINGEFVRLP